MSTNTFSNGCLGYHNDEERSEMRYVMRIAKSSESSKFWTQLALLRKYVCWSVCPSQLQVSLKTFLVAPTVWSILLWMSFDEWLFTAVDECMWHHRGLHRQVTLILTYSSLDSSTDSNNHLVHPFGPPISQEYPLNLSILLGGGKETNQDSLSNGEWSGMCSDVKSSEMSSGEAR